MQSIQPRIQLIAEKIVLDLLDLARKMTSQEAVQCTLDDNTKFVVSYDEIGGVEWHFVWQKRDAHSNRFVDKFHLLVGDIYGLSMAVRNNIHKQNESVIESWKNTSYEIISNPYPYNEEDEQED